MRRVFCFLAAVVAVCCLSCEKPDRPSKDKDKDKDPSAAFVGEWNFTEQYSLQWGTDKSDESGSGSFTVTKVNENRVNVTGFFKSAGLISGEMMNIAAYSVDDPDMKVTFAFGPAYVKGDVLTFEYSAYGRATKNGLPWSYDKKSKVTATRAKAD